MPQIYIQEMVYLAVYCVRCNNPEMSLLWRTLHGGEGSNQGTRFCVKQGDYMRIQVGGGKGRTYQSVRTAYRTVFRGVGGWVRLSWVQKKRPWRSLTCGAGICEGGERPSRAGKIMGMWSEDVTRVIWLDVQVSKRRGGAHSPWFYSYLKTGL